MTLATRTESGPRDSGGLPFPEVREIDLALRNALRICRDAPSKLQDAMKYVLFPGGRRIRPVMILRTARGLGASPREALPAACAIELMHTYTLVHDDLPAMDDGDMRRGKASCHRYFNEATAILAGDALQALAFEILCRQVPDPRRAVALVRELAEAAGANAVVGGQILDLEPSGPEKPKLKDVQNIHARKTMALFRAAARMGAISAGIFRGHTFDAVTEFGTRFGFLFQAVDDILDEAEAKPVSLPSALGREGARRYSRQLAERALDALRGLPGPVRGALSDLVGVATAPIFSE